MSKLFSKFLGFFSSRKLVGVDKAGNRYFTRAEEIDGIVKEKRWVIFKDEAEPTSIPGKDGSPDLKSFIQQFPEASFAQRSGLQSQQDLAQLINLEHGNHRHESRLSQSTYSSHLTEIIKLAEETGVQLCLIPTRCFVPTWYFDSVLVTPQLNTAILDQFMVPHIRYPNYVGLSWILLYFSASKESNLQKELCSSIVR
ncbi:hypothetical protein ZIOFF_015650 [Zingiber officinale]|uniref:Uncharacterized protein n=1 Tax=Zingiber officinale TaxID=94328 RepID=A0A8J5HRH2_ZINOF|nr:hypothetical protein ZIOFF_015650 [Zingiber officinale]